MKEQVRCDLVEIPAAAQGLLVGSGVPNIKSANLELLAALAETQRVFSEAISGSANLT